MNQQQFSAKNLSKSEWKKTYLYFNMFALNVPYKIIKDYFRVTEKNTII